MVASGLPRDQGTYYIMLFLFTGLPGSGKTLNAIKYVLESSIFELNNDQNNQECTISLQKKNDNIQNNRRPVYCHNIRGLQIENWYQLSDEEAKNPHLIEAGAVIIYDECQDIFPVLPNSKAGNIPDHYSYMNKHRHNGHDVILITQHPKNLNTQLRRLVNKHFHFKRLFGSKIVGRYEYQQCMDEPLDFHNKKEGEYQKISLDEKYYDKYKSAEIHTVKKDIPFKRFLPLLILILLFLFAVIFSVKWFFDQKSIVSQDQNTEKKGIFSSLSNDISNIALNNKNDITLSQYIQSTQPRIEGLQHTAAIYDDLTKPVTYPRISACVNTSPTYCKCYSQQATILNVPFKMCMSIVRHGYFDHTNKDYDSLKHARTKSFR